MTRDDELFEELKRLVFPPHREPPAESVAALHAAVAGQLRPKVRRWRHKAAVGAAVFGLIAGTPAAAFAVSGILPDPLRTALHDIGLPVDSVRVAETKSAEADLRHALENGDQTEIRKDAAHLQNCLSDLGGTDRARLAPHADALLQQAKPAAARVSRPVPINSGSSGSSESSDRGSSDGGQITTPTTVKSETSGGDGDQATTTTAPEERQSTTTTVQSGSSSDGDGGSGSSDGGSGGDTATTTTTDSSH